MSVIHIENDDQYVDYLGLNETLVVVKFSADWCGPCKRIAPLYDQLAGENPSVRMLHVDESSNVEEYKTVTGLPTFRFYRNGKLLHQFTGARVMELKDSVENYLYFDE